MGRINQEIVEYGFSAKSTLSYEASILVGADSIYYMVNDAQLNVLALKTYHFDARKNLSKGDALKEVFFEDLLLKEKFRTTKIVFTTPHFTLVPAKFYVPNIQRTYFKNLTDLDESTVFGTDYIKSIDAQNVYIADKSLMTQLTNFFPEAKTFHCFTTLIQGFQKISELRDGLQVFLNIRDGQAQVCFFDGKELVLANAYPFVVPQDLIYYLLMVYEQFKLNPESIPLSVTGSITEDSEIYKYLFRYVRNVSFVPAPQYFRFGNQFIGIPQHFYFDLYCMKLCE